jgi:hypothetical protein
MRVLLFLLLAVAANVAFAADPPIVTVPEQAPPTTTAPAPEPRPSQPSNPGLNEPLLNPASPPQSGATQSGTEQSPWFVRVLPTPKTAEEAAAESREQDTRTANERGLTTYTRYLWLATGALALVALVQAALFLWQLILLRRSVQDSAAAAEAAREAADAAGRMRTRQRPMLIPQADSCFLPSSPGFALAMSYSDNLPVVQARPLYFTQGIRSAANSTSETSAARKRQSRRATVSCTGERAVYQWTGHMKATPAITSWDTPFFNPVSTQ